MRRLLRWMGYGVAGLLLCGVLAVLAFDIFTVRPYAERVEQVIADAAPHERNPPAAVRDMLHRSNGGRLEGRLARSVTVDPGHDSERMGRLRRVFTEAGVALLLPWHLSEAQLETAFLASTYMGEGVRGFSAASERYLGLPLARADARQAAQLMAIAHAPVAYLGNPERLERRVQWLLSRPPTAGL